MSIFPGYPDLENIYLDSDEDCLFFMCNSNSDNCMKFFQGDKRVLPGEFLKFDKIFSQFL